MTVTHTHAPHHPENDPVNESQTLFLLPPTSKITIKNYKRFQKQFRSGEKNAPHSTPMWRAFLCLRNREASSKTSPLSSTHSKDCQPALLPFQLILGCQISCSCWREVWESWRLCAQILPAPLSPSLLQHEVRRSICVRRIHRNL